MRQIVLDTETTGLSAADGDRIIEIGCVELDQRKPTGRNLHLYVNPERDSHEEALKVHGISNDFLQDKPKFAAIAQELADYLRGAELIIHNAPFDVGFLNKEFERLGKRNSLDALCDRLEVDNSGRTLHGALLDAELLADVYVNMTRGQDALLIEVGDSPSGEAGQTLRIDLSSFDLPVLKANDSELAAHDRVLGELNKACEQGSVWERTQSQKTDQTQAIIEG
jgi:DNA polymerase III subunit epsilon